MDTLHCNKVEMIKQAKEMVSFSNEKLRVDSVKCPLECNGDNGEGS